MTQMNFVNTEEDDPIVFVDDDDPELRRALNRAKRIAQGKRYGEENYFRQAIALPAARNSNVDNPNSGSGENKIIFTETGQFVRGLQFNQEASEHRKKDVDPPAKEEEEVVPDSTIHESAAGKGLAVALKLLKDRGTLKETIEWGGRSTDKKKGKLVGIYDNDGAKEIIIDRTDEFGRMLTPKESFRLLSHKFHGKGPGKMKQEKRMRQYQEEMKVKQMKNADTPSLSVVRMRDAQAKLLTPYLVLSGNAKPGQSRDPRSILQRLRRTLLEA